MKSRKKKKPTFSLQIHDEVKIDKTDLKSKPRTFVHIVGTLTYYIPNVAATILIKCGILKMMIVV